MRDFFCKFYTKTYFLVSVHHSKYNIGLNYHIRSKKGCFSKCVNSLLKKIDMPKQAMDS